MHKSTIEARNRPRNIANRARVVHNRVTRRRRHAGPSNHHNSRKGQPPRWDPQHFRSRQEHPRLVDERGPRLDRRPPRPPTCSAASCSTTRCSRSGCRSRRIARCARRSPAARRSTSSTADAVATALKDWAVEHGATHYTHWFQPMTGITAEKHDSFLVADGRRHGDRRVPRQGTDQGRARCVELPVGRHALHLRGARLHGVGSDEPAVAARQRQQRRRWSSRPRS